MRENLMKRKIQSGQPALGVSIMVPSPQLVEMVAALGFDWVLIDCEHGTINLETVESLVRAAEAGGIAAVARPPSKSPADILRVLDRGAMGVQVPHVNSAEDARAVVEAVKYHPLGRRGLAASTRPAQYGLGLSPEDYVTQVNRETLICVQLEEAEAIRNIDSILEVDNIDVFFIGPSDLSQSMGYPGRSDAPAVQSTINHALNTILAAGRVPGSTGNNQAIARYLDQGCLYTYTHIPRLLRMGVETFQQSVSRGLMTNR